MNCGPIFTRIVSFVLVSPKAHHKYALRSQHTRRCCPTAVLSSLLGAGRELSSLREHGRGVVGKKKPFGWAKLRYF